MKNIIYINFPDFPRLSRMIFQNILLNSSVFSRSKDDMGTTVEQDLEDKHLIKHAPIFPWITIKSYWIPSIPNM